MKRFMLIGLTALILALARPEKAHAGFISGDEALGGMSKAMDDYFKTHDSWWWTEEDLKYLSAGMELENGMNSDLCLRLTGSVILNRAYYCSWCPNTVYGVLTQKGQYAKHTVENLETVKVSERVRNIALHLLMLGPDGPETLIYQAMFPQGKHFAKVDTEYFGLAE